MKRGLEDPTPNERVTNKSKIFGMWRADDLTEWGDKKIHPVIANQRDLQNFKKLDKNDIYYEMNKKLQDDITSLAYLTKQS